MSFKIKSKSWRLAIDEVKFQLALMFLAAGVVGTLLWIYWIAMHSLDREFWIVMATIILALLLFYCWNRGKHKSMHL